MKISVFRQKRTKYVAIGLLALLIVGVLGVAFWQYYLVPAAQPLQIGIIGPFSPPGAYFAGAQWRITLAIAADYINTHGGILGRNVTFAIGDSAGIPEQGVSAMQTLISYDKVPIVVGGYHSSCAYAEIDVAHKYNIPMIIADAGFDGITAKNYKQVFRTGVLSSAEAYTDAALVEKLYTEGKIKGVTIVGDDTDAAISHNNIMASLLTNASVPIFDHLTIPKDTIDFMPSLLKLKSEMTTPSFVYAGFTTGTMFLFVSQAYEAGLSWPQGVLIEGAPEVTYPEFWSTVKDAGNYVLMDTPGHPKAKMNDLGTWFTAEFNRRYRISPTVTCYELFDAIITAQDAINRAKSLDPNAIISALQKTDLVGTRYTITFYGDEKLGTPLYHQTTRSNYIAQYQAVNQAWENTTIVFPAEFATGNLIIPPP